MSCQSTPTENARPRPSSLSPISVTRRRVIFPSLYSNRCEQDSSSSDKQHEATVNKPSSSTQTPPTRDDKDSARVLKPFSFPSPGLQPKTSSRVYDELGLDIPAMSLDDLGIPPPPNGVKLPKTIAKSTRMTTPFPSARYIQLLNELSSPISLRSPGLPPKKSRLCDELGLETSQMALGYTRLPGPRFVNKSAVLNSKHFAPKPAASGVNRTSSNGSKASPQLKGRIDRRRINYTSAASPSPNRQSTSSPCCTRETKEPCSILRASKYGTSDKSSSTLPSLVPSDSSNSSCETLHSQQSSYEELMKNTPPPKNKLRSIPSVSFDPRVWVMEYERTREEIEKTWFSPEELEHFRKQTIARLVAHNTELLPSGTGFVVQRGSISTKAVFAMPSMSSMAEDDDDDAEEQDVVNAVNAEIQNILVVDPHEVCAKLFARDFKRMIENVNVCTACSSEEARKRIAETKHFDIIIVEERLKPFRRQAPDQWTTKQEEQGHLSGSEFIKALAQEKEAVPPEDKCLFIAVSAHLDKDKEKMQRNGADFLWAKPPPKMDEIVRDVLLKALLVKREKQTLADRLFEGVIRTP